MAWGNFWKVDQAIDVIWRWAAVFSAIAAGFAWLAKRLTWLEKISWADAVLIGVGSALLISLIMSFALIAWRYFRPLSNDIPSAEEKNLVFSKNKNPTSQQRKIRHFTASERDRIIDTSKSIYSIAVDARKSVSTSFSQVDVRIKSRIDLINGLASINKAISILKESCNAVKCEIEKSQDKDDVNSIVRGIIWSIGDGPDTIYSYLVEYRILIESLIENKADRSLVHYALIGPRDKIHASEQKFFEIINEVAKEIDDLRQQDLH